MKSIIAVIALVVLLCGSALSQSTNYTVEAPFVGIFSAPCMSEAVAVSGTLVSHIHQMFNDNSGNVGFHTKEGSTTSGVGMSSGATYRVNVNQFAKFMFDGNVMSDTALRQKFVLQGPSDLTIRYVLRTFWDEETQQFRTKFESSTVECK